MKIVLRISALIAAAVMAMAVPAKAVILTPAAAVQAGCTDNSATAGAAMTAGGDAATQDARAAAGSVRNLTPAPQKARELRGICRHEACKPFLKVVADASVPSEGYVLELGYRRVKVRASDAAGVYYALVSLAQMAGADCHQASVPESFLTQNSWSVERCRIEDSPRFAYRGLMVDSSRHLRSKEFIFKHLDAMAAMRLNRLHFHLTDAAGWRLETGSYPRLTEFAAWRSREFYRDWSFGRKREEKLYCNGPAEGGFGGFYTKDDIREIVAYAAERHITVVPEIEMPGHSDEVLAAYPELSCTGEPYTCGDLCAGKEATFEFLEKVLDETMDLFPSEYIHIGGDEAGKSRWKTCPDCQRRMQEEGLNSVDELQSWFIKRIENYVESRGRHIIGWDEILQGGLAPKATVMSWRGTEGGKAAVAAGHDAIMTPGRWCYIDTAQDAPDKEPASFGNYLPISRVYEYDPEDGIYPEGAGGASVDGAALAGGNAASGSEAAAAGSGGRGSVAGRAGGVAAGGSFGRVLGVQANLWAELVETDELAEYMYWPRAIALAEVAWTQPGRKDYTDFRRRALMVTEKMRAVGYNTFDLANEQGDRAESLKPIDHLAVGCPVRYNGRIYSKAYPAAGEATLTDGIGGSWAYNDGRWQGFLSDIDVTIDLGSMKPVHSIRMTFQQNSIHGVYLPDTVKVMFPISMDGPCVKAGNLPPAPSDAQNSSTVTFVAGPEVDPSIPGAHFRDYILLCEETLNTYTDTERLMEGRPDASATSSCKFITTGNTEGIPTTVCRGISTRYIRIVAPRSAHSGFLFLDEIIVL